MFEYGMIKVKLSIPKCLADSKIYAIDVKNVEEKKKLVPVF